MDIPTIHPPAIKAGDTVGIVAPAGPIEERRDFDRGVAALEQMGFRVRFNLRIFESMRYLAGADADRAEELMRFIEDPEVNAILALRGGYGCSRLIPRLDEKRLRSHCKPFIGFSDLTTLHLYFKRRLGWVTFHGPMVASPNFPSAVSGQGNHLRSLLCDPNYLPCLRFQEMQVIAPGVADGKLVGGCLSLVVASLGTPYEIRTEGKILFLEDLGEPPYRIDRMLMQLKLAGKLQETAGVLLGTFKECEPGNPDYTLLDVFQEILQPLGVPVLYGFPAGHGQENWAIPLGVGVRLDADNKSVEFLEPAVLGRNQDHDA